MLGNHILVAAIIFLLTYILIISEKMNRTVAAMLGAVLMIVFQVLPQEHAFQMIDFNTIGLLIGMMMIVIILKKSGIFQYVAIKTAKASKGNSWQLFVMFAAITAAASAFLDNVTTILLIMPVTLVITDTLKLDPVPFALSAIFAANIGGTATLVGDPPNIMIGGATGLGFMDFICNLAPAAVVVYIATILTMKFIFRKHFKTPIKNNIEVLRLDENKAIQNKALLVESLVVLGITILGFIFHKELGLEPATIALLGAMVLMLVSKTEPEEVLLEVEWDTVVFFIGLFILVGGLEEAGVIGYLAEKLVYAAHGDFKVIMLLVLWISAILSAFIDNVSFVAAMIPLIQSIEAMSSVDISPLWWALSLGACLGGNGTIVGASANIGASDILKKRGIKIGFQQYMKIGFPLMMISIFICTVYLWLFYV